MPVFKGLPEDAGPITMTMVGEPERYMGLLARMKYQLQAMRRIRTEGMNRLAEGKKGVWTATGMIQIRFVEDHFGLPRSEDES